MDKIYKKEISKSIINGDRSAEHPYIFDKETAPMFSQYLEEKVKRVISSLQVSNKVSLYGVLSGKTHSNQTNGVYWNYTKNVPSTVSNGNIWMKKARNDVINICSVFNKKLNDFYYCLSNKQLIKTIRRRGYIIDEDFFEDGQLQLLIDSVLFNPNLDKKSANDLVNKLALISSVIQMERLNTEHQNDNELTYDLLLNLTTVIKAINNHKNIAFKYISYDIKDNALQEVYHTNGNLNSETYVISPYKLILRNSNYYLIGYFDKRKDSLSVYRIDRMRIVRNHSSSYEDIQDRFDMEKEFENNVNMYVNNERIDLKIAFESSVLREVVNQFGQDINVNKCFDGRIEAFIKDVALSDGLIGWIMMLQDKVEVVFPLSLKEIVKTRIRAMLRIYE